MTIIWISREKKYSLWIKIQYWVPTSADEDDLTKSVEYNNVVPLIIRCYLPEQCQVWDHLLIINLLCLTGPARWWCDHMWLLRVYKDWGGQGWGLGNWGLVCCLYSKYLWWTLCLSSLLYPTAQLIHICYIKHYKIFKKNILQMSSQQCTWWCKI